MIVCMLLVAVSYLWFITTPYFDPFLMWSRDNKPLFVVVLLTIKVFGIVFPPIPGGTFTLGAVPVLGWWEAYLVDFGGGFIGAVIAYYLGQKYGYSLLRKVFDEKVVAKLQKTKIKVGRELEAMFVFRIIGSGLLTEAIYYAAGLLSIGKWNFVIGYILTHILLTAPAFYVADVVLSAQNLALNLVFIVIAIPVMWKIKGRYLE